MIALPTAADQQKIVFFASSDKIWPKNDLDRDPENGGRPPNRSVGRSANEENASVWSDLAQLRVKTTFFAPQLNMHKLFC